MGNVKPIHSGIESPATQLGRVYLILRDATDWMDADGIADVSQCRWERVDSAWDIADAIEELLDMGYDIDAQEMPGVSLPEYRMAQGDSAA